MDTSSQTAVPEQPHNSPAIPKTRGDDKHACVTDDCDSSTDFRCKDEETGMAKQNPSYVSDTENDDSVTKNPSYVRGTENDVSGTRNPSYVRGTEKDVSGTRNPSYVTGTENVGGTGNHAFVTGTGKDVIGSTNPAFVPDMNNMHGTRNSASVIDGAKDARGSSFSEIGLQLRKVSTELETDGNGDAHNQDNPSNTTNQQETDRQVEERGGASCTTTHEDEGKANHEDTAITGGSQTLEDLMAGLGGFGLYQFFLLAVIFGAKMSVSYSIVINAIAAATPDWWCRPLNNFDGVDGGVVNGSDDGLRFQQCEVNGTTCPQFTFSSSVHSVVSEWDLVCQQRWITSTLTSVQMVGLLVGAVGGGQLADFWGRRNTLFLALLAQALFSLISGFSPSWHVFISCRFFVGIASGGYMVVYYPLPLEFLGPRWRSIQSAIPTWSLGICVLSLVGWLTRDWRWLNWVGAAFSGVFLLAYPFVPESVRWLVLHNRIDEAEKVIRQVARVNRKKMPDLDLVQKLAEREISSESKKVQTYTYLDLCRSWGMLKVTLCFNFNWFVCGLVFFALSFGAEQLSGSLYLNMFLLAAVEIPPLLVTTYLNNRLGRRWTSFMFMAGASVTAAAVAILEFVSEERGTAVSVMVLLCKLMVAAAQACIILFSTESFPTVVRSVGYGSCNVSGRIGGIIAPYLVMLGATHFEVTYSVIAVMTALSAGVSLLCQDTKGRALEDTLTGFLSNQKSRDPKDRPEAETRDLHSKGEDVNTATV